MDTGGGFTAEANFADVTSLASRSSKNRSEGLSLFGGAPNPVHHMAQPFFSNLEVMDYVVGRKMNAMVRRADKSMVMHRAEREYYRKKQRATPEI